MKKQESGKKTAKWLIPVLVAVLVAVVGVAAFLAFGGGDSQGDTPVTTPTVPAGEDELVLYWNVDRMSYVGQGMDNNSARLPRSDGYYYIRFAVNGEQVDLPVREKSLVDRIDMVDIMSLILDEEGFVVDMRTLNECTGGLLAPALYVESVEGNIVHTKTNGNFGGLAIDLEITEDVKVFDVGGVGLLVGIPGQVKVDDEVLAVQDKDGKLIYCFVKSYEPPNDIYWNIYRKYNTTTKRSTRESSVTGVYEFIMACNGELVTVRTRDFEVANKMDSYASKCQALEFDEDGYVISTGQGTSVMKTSGTWGSWAHILEINDDYVIAEKLSGDKMGTVYEAHITKDTKIIDVSAAGGYSGAYTELRVGDQVHGLLDRRGRLSHVFVHSRLVDCELYWNCERKYDSTTKQSTRVPDAQGYYWFNVATGGKQLRVRTNDREIANNIDVTYAARCFGLELDGQDIVKVHGAGSIHGGSTFGSWYYVDKLEGKKITVKRILTGDTVPTYQEGVLADDVEIINGSDNFTSHCGEYSSLAVGDRVHCMKNLKGEIRVVFIVEKPVDSPVYWNITRMYNSTTKQTTRVPDEDGYYVFKMAVDGKQVKLKTKDKALATKIDANAACCWGLQVYNGIIYKAYGVGSIRGLSGGTKSISWVDVDRVSGGSFTATKNQAGHKDDGKHFTSSIGWGCKIINTTSATKSHIGEYTDLRVGDRIHVLHDGDGYAKVIFVVGGRQKELNTDREDCPCAQNPAWEAWDGTTALKDGGYYYLTADVQAPKDGFLIEGITVALRLDGHTISTEGRCFFVKAGGQLSICDHVGGGKLVGTGINGESGGVIRMYTDSGEAYVKLWNLELTADDTDSNTANQGGIISASGPISLYNCNVHGGTSSSTGGGMHINQSGTLRMFDTTVTGGKASGNGGNVHINNGSFYFENVTLSDGQAGGKGDNMNIGSDKQMKINGLTLTHSAKNANGLNMNSGTVGIAGDVQIHASGKDNVTMAAGAVFVNDGLDPASRIVVKAGEQVIMTGADETVAACIESYDANDYITVYDPETKELSFKCIIEPKSHDFEHCICAGLGEIGDHSCQDEFGWTEINDSVFEEAMGTNGNAQGVKFKESGNYYLSVDYMASRQICIMPDQTINICLNGNDLTRSSGTLFMVAGNLNVTDCYGTGTASGAEAGNGGTVKVVSGGTFNLFGGTFTCDAVSSSGATVNVTQDKGYIADPADTRPGVFNMYGGTLNGGQAGSGGNVNVWHSAHFTMYGGTISDGSASTKGGNIAVAGSGCVVKLLGGTITGGSSAQGGGVYTNRNITIGPNMKIYGNTGADVYLDGDVVMVFDGYTPTEVMTVNKSVPGVIADSATDLSAWFESANSDLVVTYKEGQLKLSLSSSAQGHIHCVCSGCADGKYAHECENVLFQPWTESDSLPKSGYYYLTQDVTLTTVHKVGANTLILCLNGYTIRCESNRLFHMDNGASDLTVTDCQGKGALEATGIADGNGGGIIRNGYGTSKVSLYNLTLTRIDDPANRVQVKEGGLISCSGYLNLYNVTATNGYAQKCGGILVALTAKVVIVDSTVSGCTGMGNTGGNIHIGGNNASNKASVVLINTTVTGGKGSDPTGNDIFLGGADKNDLFVGGKIVTGDLRMGGTNNIQVLDMGLTEDASIGISMATNGKIGASDTDVSACFKPLDTTMVVDYTDGTLSLKKPSLGHPAHCICGGKTVGVGDHVCETVSAWTEISADVFTTAIGTNSKSQGIMFAESGNYYLNDHYALSAQLCIMPDQQITICLNGYTLSRSGGKTIMCAGQLNITDCKTNGTIQSNVNNDNCTTVKIVKGGHVAMYGGTLTNSGTRTSRFGGILGVSKDSGYITSSSASSSFTMYGGTISGGKATEHGGNIVGWSAVDITIYGGTISGGEAGTHGGNIGYSGTGTLKILGGNFIGGSAANGKSISVMNGTFILGGNVNIQDGDIYLAQNKEIKINTLTNTDPIPVTMAIPGVFATNVTTDVSGKFASTDSGYQVKYDAGMKTLSLLPGGTAAVHADHCICGGSAEGLGDHTACADVTWIPISEALAENGMTVSTADFGKLPSGNYYLDANVNVSVATYIGGDGGELPTTPVNLNLCLNGRKITTTDTNTKRVFGRIYAGSSVSLCDCSGEQDTNGSWTWKGTVEGGKAANGQIVYTYEGGEVSIYGGNYVAPSGYTSTGVGLFCIAMDKGLESNPKANAAVMNLYNGNLQGCPTKRGAAIALMHRSTLNMYGGLVTGSTVTADGGAIDADGGSTLKLMGGKVIDGTAGGNGNGIYVKYGSVEPTEVFVGGSFRGNIVLADKVELVTADLNSQAKVGIGMVKPGIFARNVTTDISASFDPIGAYKVSYNPTAKTLSLVAAVHENHCVCEGAEVTAIQGHTCEDVTWTALTQAMFDNPDGENVTSGTYYTLKDGGHYYLTGDLNLDKPLGVAKGQQASLCLNGNTVTASGRALELEGTLDLCDCQTEAGTLKGNLNDSGATFKTLAGSQLNIYSGNIQGYTVTASNATAGNGYVSGNVTMYGGKIFGGTSTANGGNLLIADSAMVNLYGGTITDGTTPSSKSGGNIRIDKGTLRMYGGTISNGYAKEGGNVNVGANGRMEMYGGVIENGTATNAGGNVTVFSTFIMKDTAIIRNGTVTGQEVYGGGGNIYGMQNKTNITIEGGSVYGGSAHQGANVFLRTNTSVKISFTMTGGSVSGVATGAAGKSIECLSGAVNFTLGGTAVIDEIELNGQQIAIHADGFASGAAIGVSMVTPGKFATVGDAFDYTTVFTSANAAYQVEQTATELKLTAK